MNNKKDIPMTYKGKSKIKLSQHSKNSSQKKDNKLFGLWLDRDFDVDKYIRDIRKER